MRRAVVVTGASTGIGAAAAEALARAGLLVFGGVRSTADGDALARRHAGLRPLALDVTAPDQIAAAARAVAASGATLAGLVSNAGIAVAGPLEFLPVDELRRQFEVNVFGAIAVAQAFLPQLRRDAGRLIFVGSISGRLAIPFVAPYSASKFALRACADALRVELAPSGVRVALIEPGSVRTPIWAKGRASRERLITLLGPAAMSIYGAHVEAVLRRTATEERGGMPVERVVRAIEHALLDAKPRTHYVLGAAARAGSILALLPAALRDRALRRSLRL